MTRRWTLPIVLLLASVATPADAPKPLGHIERSAEFNARVGAAIDRGVAWLKKTQAADGSWPDYTGFSGASTALAYHTMRVCGVAPADPAASRAWESLRRTYTKKDLWTYAATVYLMAIASHGDPVPNARDDRDVTLSADDARWAAEIAGALAAAQQKNGVWGYELDSSGILAVAMRAANGGDGYYDHSNTQYALLGLKAAARCGVAVDPAVWTKSLAHFLAAQEKSGPATPRRPVDKGAVKGVTNAVPSDRARGWGYVGPEMKKFEWHAYSSMTAGGVSSVVICRSELMGTPAMSAKLDADSERSAWDGLAWLGTHWVAKAAVKSPGVGTADLYEFYGVERAGVLAGVERMADLDWYGVGAAALLEAQASDGSWTGAEGRCVNPGTEQERATARHTVDTCFALLFLKKGTTPVRRGAVTQSFDDTDIKFGEAPKLNGSDFEDFIDLVLSRWRRAADDGVRSRLFDGAASVGPRIVEPLLVRLVSPDVDKRAAAHALLRHATGLDFGYVADAPSDARETALAKWLAWWIGAKDRTAYDPASKRLVVK